MARKHIVLVLGMIIYYFSKAVCVHAREGLVLPRASHSGEITLSGSCMRSKLAVALVLFAHAIVTEAKNRTSATPKSLSSTPVTLVDAMEQKLQNPYPTGEG